MGPFGTNTPDFGDFLRNVAGDPEQVEAFTARNFLLDEGIPPQRVDSYFSAGAAAAHADYPTWAKAHEDYLYQKVFLPQDDPRDLTSISLVDPTAGPETFRYTLAASPFATSDSRLHLLRVEEIGRVERVSKVAADRIRELAEHVVESGHGNADTAGQTLDAILGDWSVKIDCRPVFTAFWADIDDLKLFGNTPSLDAPDWADRLRDKLGLVHLDPNQREGRPIGVLILRYPISAAPSVAGNRMLRPLVQPTVLDSRHSPAFCPSPGPEPTGYTVDLACQSPPICREALHPAMRFRAAHVWRVGEIRRGLGDSLNVLLSEARGLHLLCLRDQCCRNDYAADTDGDLL